MKLNTSHIHIKLFGKIESTSDGGKSWKTIEGLSFPLAIFAYALCSNGTASYNEIKQNIWSGGTSYTNIRQTLKRLRDDILINLVDEDNETWEKSLLKTLAPTKKQTLVIDTIITSDVQRFLEIYQKSLNNNATIKELKEALILSQQELLIGYETVKTDNIHHKADTYGWIWVDKKRRTFLKYREQIKEKLANLNEKNSAKLDNDSKAVFLSFKHKAESDLHQLLHEKKGGFQNKYLRVVYTKRKKAEKKFQDFIEQKESCFFVVTGPSGVGKTCLLCNLAEKSAELLLRKQIPLLIDAKSLKPTEVSLKKYILNKLNHSDFDNLGAFLKKNKALLLIFIDGINELSGRKDLDSFNNQLFQLSLLIKEKKYPILFCLSCRTQSWQRFETTKWAKDQIFRKPGDDVTADLDKFDFEEVEEVIKGYFEFYRIEGVLKGDAKDACRDPLMLRFLCEAYTKRPVEDYETPSHEIEPSNIKEVNTFRRKDIFDLYAEARRKDLSNLADENVSHKKGRITKASPEEINELTTRYVINLAHKMLKNKSQRITINEIKEVAEKLLHPDRKLEISQLKKSTRSVFFRLLDMGVFNYNAELKNAFSFVYETYFEYSLGRYIARESWTELKTKGTQTVVDDLGDLLNQHIDLNKEGFPNLFNAIRYAILETEIDWFANVQSTNRNSYQDKPELFIELLKYLAKPTTSQFDRIQQACLIMRESKLMQPELWENKEQKYESEKIKKVESDFKSLIRILDELTSQTDFVVLWDIQKTLQAMALINFKITVNEVSDWAMRQQGLKPIFATQTLAKLCSIKKNDPEGLLKIIKLLLELIKQENYRKDFWLARSIIFAVSELAKFINDLEDTKFDYVLNEWKKLRNDVKALAKSAEDPYIRAVALPVLPLLSEGGFDELQEITQFVDEETWKWTHWNLAYELRNWPEYWDKSPDSWIWKMLEKLAEKKDPHICFAIQRTLNDLGKRWNIDQENILYKRIKAIEKKISGKDTSSWLRSTGALDYDKIKQIGIVYSPAYLEPAYDNHVECRERLQAIINKLEKIDDKNFNWVNPTKVDDELLDKVHTKENDYHRDGTPWLRYVENVREASSSQQTQTGPSELRFESYEIAKLSAGGVVEAINYVYQKGSSSAAFVLNRPPGHLANNTICIFNNIAVGAEYARQYQGVRRILIVDCDAHHGKHTQQVFSSDPEVIYFSMHIDNNYTRETGNIDNIGEGEGKGYTFNLPYPNNMTDKGYKFIIDNLLRPLALDFKPELILVSAGFDGHFDDPLTPNCLLTDDAYIHLSETLYVIAKKLKAKLVGAIEGGYGLEGLSHGVVNMISIWGEWDQEVQKKIGQTSKPKNLKFDPKSYSNVKKQVKHRINLIKEYKTENEDYFVNLKKKHWQNQ